MHNSVAEAVLCCCQCFFLVYGEMHQIHEQERLHSNGNLWDELLPQRQKCVLLDIEECCTRHCHHHCERRRRVRGENVHHVVDRRTVLFCHGSVSRRGDPQQFWSPVLDCLYFVDHRLHVHERLRNGHGHDTAVLRGRRGDVWNRRHVCGGESPGMGREEQLNRKWSVKSAKLVQAPKHTPAPLVRAKLRLQLCQAVRNPCLNCFSFGVCFL